MKTIIFALVFVVSCAGIAHSGHSSRHHHSYRSSNGNRVQLRHRDIVYNPDRMVVSPDTTNVKETWPYVEAEVMYPYATGSSVLDLARTTIPYDRNVTCAAPMIQVMRLSSIRE